MPSSPPPPPPTRPSVRSSVRPSVCLSHSFDLSIVLRAAVATHLRVLYLRGGGVARARARGICDAVRNGRGAAARTTATETRLGRPAARCCVFLTHLGRQSFGRDDVGQACRENEVQFQSTVERANARPLPHPTSLSLILSL